MDRLDICWWGLILNYIIFIFFSNWLTAEGCVRQSRKIEPHSPVIKLILGFPVWVEEMDRLLVIINEAAIIGLVTGWFTFYRLADDTLIGKIESFFIFLLIAEFVGFFVVGYLSWKEEKKENCIRESFDLCIRSGMEDSYNYIYIYTHKKNFQIPIRLLYFYLKAILLLKI